MVRIFTATQTVAFAVLTAMLLVWSATASTAEEGFHLTPSVSWSKGDHRLDFPAVFRLRWEHWNARATSDDDFFGIRLRFAGRYAWKKTITLFAQGQYTAITDLSSDSSGAGGLYYNVNGQQSTTDSIRLKQAWLDIRPTAWSQLRLGRMEILQGTWDKYSEPNWTYVKTSRISQRLVGAVGWTHVARSFDGGYGAVDLKGHKLRAFVAQPTEGVFTVEDAYETLDDVIIGAVDWTAPPGLLARNTEFNGFFIGYGDSRDTKGASPAPVFGDVELYTLGGYALGIYPLGPGKIDVLLWGALQVGKYANTDPADGRLDHLAGAVLAEFGYQLTDIYGKPWLRTGVNWASGDDDPSDGDHNTFHNLLPTNHLYYGYVDQLAFQNLINWFMQVKWAPLPRFGFEFVAHRFWLSNKNDFRYFGTGAITQSGLGYNGSSSQGSTDVGWELDMVLSYAINKYIAIAGGYAYLFGGDVFAGTPNDRDVQWGFLQLVLMY